MKITYHGHSAFRIETGGAVILVDPFFSGNPAAKATWQEASAGLTHLLLTHGQPDVDREASVRIATRAFGGPVEWAREGVPVHA